MTDVVIAADLGPNPAPVVELAWALYRHRHLRAVQARLLTNAQGASWRGELDHGLALLRGVLEPAVLPAEQVHLARVRAADGRLVEDELDPADAEAWTRARWDNFRQAIEAAGERPVVFGLVGGRRRTMGALTSAMAMLLARPQDLCLDVRVSEPRVEGARAGFYFPEQAAPCRDARGAIDPAAVRVHLVELRLPRLRQLLVQHDLHTYEQALAATGVALDRLVEPTLVVDVPGERVELDGQRVALSEGQFLCYAVLALARVESSNEGWVSREEQEVLLRRVMRARAAGAVGGWEPVSTYLRKLYQDEAIDETDLSKLRADARTRLRQHCQQARTVRPDLVVPEKRRSKEHSHQQRIALDPTRITVHLGETS